MKCEFYSTIKDVPTGILFFDLSIIIQFCEFLIVKCWKKKSLEHEKDLLFTNAKS